MESKPVRELIQTLANDLQCQYQVLIVEQLCDVSLWHGFDQMKVVEGEEHLVLYISHKLSTRESKYSTMECLAIKWVGLTLWYYLLGHLFTLCSDHAPPQWLHCMKDANGQITHWYLALQPFKFEVVHSLGAQMVVADYLSCQGRSQLEAGWLHGLSRAVGVCGSKVVVKHQL